MKLLKTMVVLTLVVGLLLGGVLPAQADTGVTSTQPSPPLKPEWGKGRWVLGKVEVIRGVVEEVVIEETPTEETPNKIILKLSEEEFEEIIVGEATKFRVPTLGKEASLEDIEVGMQVVVQAYKAGDDGMLHARHIVVIPSRPIYGHHVGKLLEYTDGEHITIEDKWENIITFDIVGELKVLPPGTTVEEGDWVTVITRGHPLSGSRIAIGVVVHPTNPILARLRILNRLEIRLLNRLEWQGIERVNGTITVDEAEELITIDSTELNYDGSTIFILRGVPSVQGQSGIVFYKDELAKLVLVRVEPSEIEED